MPAGATKPRAVRASKPKLTLEQAAIQFERAKKLEAQAKALRAESDPVLQAYFDRNPAKATYKDRIGFSWRGGSDVLDTDKVKEFLGRRLPEFVKKSKRSRSLTLVGPAGGD